MTMKPVNHLDFHDIQGVVINAYGHLNHSRFVFLKIVDARAAKRWLAHLANQISSAERRRGEDEPSGAQTNVAFTLSGMEKLGLPAETLAAFPREFQMGMAAPERSRRLGDLGDNPPESWQFGGPSTTTIDLLLMLYGRDEAILEQVAKRAFDPSPASNGLEEVSSQTS